ncbi:MAG: DUF6557 family protein [Thermodesulfobacteriota bacterium]|nr:DUF6557 family protein [Thermodesulfobacteriota bacterium]
MKFAELVCKYDWGEIRPAILRLYPNDQKNISGFKMVFEQLQTPMPAETNMRIILKEVFDEFENERYICVSGVDGTLKKEENPEIFKDDKIGNQEVSYGIEFTDWEEWLGMDIDPESTSNYHEPDIIAHCLWEMSFYGYTQEAIKKTIDMINRESGKHATAYPPE